VEFIQSLIRVVQGRERKISTIQNLLAKLETLKKRKIIIYCGPINSQLIQKIYPFVNSKQFWDGRVDLFLYTKGGHVVEAKQFIVLLRSHFDFLNIIVPYQVHSAGTIICLGADELTLSSLAEMTPIDAQSRSIVEVEKGVPTTISSKRIQSFIEMSNDWFNLDIANNGSELIKILSSHIFPLTLSHTYEADKLVRLIASELLCYPLPGDENCAIRKTIVNKFLDRHYAHNYIINRNDVKRIGLPLTIPSDEEEQIMWSIQQLLNPYINRGIIITREEKDLFDHIG